MPQNNPPNRDALVIGIGKYTDLTPHKLPELVNDAEKIAQILETQGGFRVRRVPVTQPGDKEIIDPEQTVIADELKSAIEQLLMPKSEHLPTTALLFFAGHGLRQEIKANRYEGFLATSEACPAEDEWGISLQWLRELLDKSPIPQQIVWLDACHSGSFQTYEVLETSQVLAHDRCFISSARAHEEAYADGLLTKALLETLDYTKQLNPWVDHLTLIEWLKVKNQTAAGSQRFVFANTDKPIILTNKAFDVGVDYKDVCPFKGLQSFDFEKNPDDPLYFKGRTELTNELVEKVQGANFLAVLGASGNGKSSVVRAGLLYQLQQTQRWEILPVITPTDDPLKALGSVIGMPAAQLTDFIDRAQAERQVLVIDQFEEIFTVCKNDAEREQFLATLLAEVARADNKFCLVVVIRADFFDKYSQHVDLAKQIQAHQIIVTPMTAAELEEAIVAPTQQVGLQIEPKLVSEMLADVKGALGSLPLLQYTLRELWTKCATHRLLTFSAYEELGKISGTLEKGANGVYAELSPPEQKTAQRIFIELTQLGEGAPDTRRQLSQQDLVTSLPFESAPVGEVIQKLVAANLVVTDKPKEEQVAIVNIAHEALIQHWGQLGGWLDGNREFIRWKRRLEYQIDEWIRGDRNPDFLLRGIALDETKQWYKKKKSELSRKERRFIRACSLQRLKKKVYGFAVILILVASLGWFGIEWLDIKIRQEIYAENPGLHETVEFLKELPEINQVLKSINIESAKSAERLLQGIMGSQSAGISLEGAITSGSNFNFMDLIFRGNSEQDMKLLGGSNYFSAHFPMLEKYLMLSKLGLSLTDASNELQNYSIDIDDDFRAVTFSPNNKLLGIAVPSHIVRILDIETKQEVTRIPHEHDVNQIKFDFASQWLATVSNNEHLLQVWNPISGDKIFEHLYDEDINSLAFSPNNKLIAIGSEDKIAQVWEISSGQLLTKMVHEAPIEFIEFDPTGKWLSTRTSDEKVAAWIWDINTGKQVTNLIPKLELKAIAFSPNEEWFVVSGNDNMARVINIDSGNQIAKVIHKSEITFAKFDPNSRALLTASRDGKLKLLEVKSGKELPLTGNKYIISAMFHQDKWLITLDKDFLVSIFEVETGKEIAQIANENTVRDLAFSPNGKWMVIATANGVAQIWEIDTRQLIVEVKHDASIITTAFSQNNHWLATGGHDSTARIWDVNTGDEILKLSHDGPVNFVIFSDNNQWLATASMDKTVRVWEVATGKEISRLLHEKPASIIAFKENSKRIATASMGWDIIRIWKTETGEETTHIYDLPKLEQRFKSLNQSPLLNRQP